MRVIAFDERILLLPPPTFQLLFPSDGIANITKVRAINKNDTMVVSGKAGNFSSSMLRNAYQQIVGHTNVERGACLIAHHVNPVIVISRQFVRSFDSAQDDRKEQARGALICSFRGPSENSITPRLCRRARSSWSDQARARVLFPAAPFSPGQFHERCARFWRSLSQFQLRDRTRSWARDRSP